MRADRAVLLASRALTLMVSECIAVAEVALGALPVFPEGLDFPGAGGGVDPSPGPPILPCPFWASRLPEPGARREPSATKSTIDRFIRTPPSSCENYLIGPHAPHNRAQIDSDAERDCIERIMNAPRVGHLQLEYFGGMNAAPERKPVIASQIRGADRKRPGFKYTLAAASATAPAGGRRCSRSSGQKFADDGLLPRGLDRVRRGAGVQEPRHPICRSSFEMSHETQRGIRADEERSVGHRVCKSDSAERSEPRKGPVETIGPVDRRPACAEPRVLVAGRRRAGHNRRVVD